MIKKLIKDGIAYIQEVRNKGVNKKIEEVMTKKSIHSHTSEEKKPSKPSAELEALIQSTDVMEMIKSQFGYSGYSNPNYVNLCNRIDENKKLIEKINGGK